MNRLFPTILLAISLTLPACGDDDEPTPSPTPTPDVGSTQDTDGGTDAASTDSGFPALEFVHIDTAADAPIEATEFHFVPGAPDELVVLEKDGFISHYRLDGDSATRLGRVEISGVYSDLDCGLLSLAFDPDFTTNRLVYIGQCTSKTHSAIHRVTWTPDALDSLGKNPVEIISAGDTDTQYPWHNVGSIGFGSEGVLWSIWGDKRVSANGQDPSNVLGGVARVIPNREEGVGGYEPAPGNPFLDGVDGSDALYAWGFRAPWRGSLDRHGRFWLADVGENDWEELNLVTEAGQNFGWPTHEGTCSSGCEGFSDPIAEYDHEDVHPYILDDDDAEPVASRAIWVSPELRAVEGDPYGGRLDEHVLLGEFCVGFIRAIQADADHQLTVDKHIGHLANVTQVEQAEDGTLYMSVYGACKSKTPEDPPGGLYRAVLAGQ